MSYTTKQFPCMTFIKPLDLTFKNIVKVITKQKCMYVNQLYNSLIIFITLIYTHMCHSINIVYRTL